MDSESFSGPMLSSALVMAAYGVLLLPLLSFLINGLWLGRKSAKASGWMAALLMGGTLGLAIVVALAYHAQVLGNPQFPGQTALAFDHLWLPFGPGATQAARFGFLLDPISVMMVLVVACISFLVHVYSIGYMEGDPGAGRFFPTLSFFTFAMLGLVASSNLLETFFFWELVGVSSYLLIGFWYRKPAAVAASKKAFIMTRFADAFFLMGALLVGLRANGFDFLVLNSPAAAAALNQNIALGFCTVNLLALGTFLIYMGAWGKSAMFPLHGWLPDAMEGPTPVSSLIHSATMVVAGVYLTARLFPLFSAAGSTLTVVEITGGFTAVFAAVIACTQMDLKRILAFSTLSQLGLMMASLGAGAPAHADAGQALPFVPAYSASMFHVFTHAFFKCLLFLSAGVIIHAIHSNDIRDAGGLRKVLPLTYGASLIAVLSLSGIPPFSGFFSKDEILMAAVRNGHYFAFAATLITGGLTAFYMTRYFLLAFHGTAGAARAGNADSADAAGRSHAPGGHAPSPDGRAGTSHGHAAAHAAAAGPAGKSHGQPAPREAWLMVLPILILAVPSAVIGWLTKDFFVTHVLPGALAGTMEAGASSPEGGPAWLPWIASAAAASGLLAGWFLYGRKNRKVGYPEGAMPAWYRLIQNKFYIDHLYLFLARKAVNRGVAAPAQWTERKVINGSFDAGIAMIRGLAAGQSRFQNGQVQRYIGVALLGLILLCILGRIIL